MRNLDSDVSGKKQSWTIAGSTRPNFMFMASTFAAKMSECYAADFKNAFVHKKIFYACP